MAAQLGRRSDHTGSSKSYRYRTNEGTYCATVKGSEGTLASAGATREDMVRMAHEMVLDRVDHALDNGETLSSVMDDVPVAIYKLIGGTDAELDDDLPAVFGPWAMPNASVAAYV